MDLHAYVGRAVDAVRGWESRWGAFERHGALEVDEERLRRAFDRYTARLEGNFPFFHPRYAGQMLKPPHPVAVAGYLAAMLVNPNNHALDGGRPTSEMEKDVVRELARMFGFPGEALGHLTTSGTIANLEGLWIARELHPEKAVAVSSDAHYTHVRMGRLLRLPMIEVPADRDGRLRLDVLEKLVRSGDVGTVVLTAGTTGLGVVDPIEDVLPWRDRYGVRIHVDAAYGGFFRLLAGDPDSPLGDEARRHLLAISECDAVVVDPHKHGLQPYGCGCVLFRDPSVGRFYKHDSPYTYFTSDELHLGEISLECSRAGAAAGALWLTLMMFPLEARQGLGPVLAAGVRAARAWWERMHESDVLRPYTMPELDLLTYFPVPGRRTTGAVDLLSQAVFEAATTAPEDPVFLSLYRVPSETFAMLHPAYEAGGESTRLLRSVLMKPEHEDVVDDLHDRLVGIVRAETSSRPQVPPEEPSDVPP